jgi:cytochrome c
MRRLIACAALCCALPATAPAAQRADAAVLRAGEAVYERCLGCHALAYERTGPRHCGLFGRRAGSLAGFAYSAPMQASEIVWNARTLDRFLENPARTVPGTSMGYAGVADPAERAALIAYLKHANNTPACQSMLKRSK